MESPCRVRTCNLPAYDDHELCTHHGAQFDLSLDQPDDVPGDEWLSRWCGAQEQSDRLEAGIIETA